MCRCVAQLIKWYTRNLYVISLNLTPVLRFFSLWTNFIYAFLRNVKYFEIFKTMIFIRFCYPFHYSLYSKVSFTTLICFTGLLIPAITLVHTDVFFSFSAMENSYIFIHMYINLQESCLYLSSCRSAPLQCKTVWCDSKSNNEHKMRIM